MKYLSGFVVVAVLLFSSLAFAEVPAPLRESRAGKLGTILTDSHGMTLYTFAKDTQKGKSACSGRCAELWPPLLVNAKDPAPREPLGVISRADGSKQYTYKGKPLYRFKNDKKPGETRGDHFRGVWFAAHP